MRLLTLVSVGALVGAGLAARLSIAPASPPVPPIDSSVRAVACPAAGRCLSVGLTGSKYTVRVPLAALQKGSAWTVRRHRFRSQRGDMYPTAVACRSSSSCVAVGVREVPASYFGAPAAGDRPFAQTWDGKTWRTRAPAVPPGTADAQLNGVACVSSMCMAVGQYAKRLQDDRALGESWDGKAWKIHVPPTLRWRDEAAEVELSDVTCLSVTSCIAVGRFSVELIEGIVPIIGPLVERWDGKHWRVARVAKPASFDAQLNAISCHSRQRCVAVGSQLLRSRAYGSLTETWDGTGWHELRAVNPPHSTNTELVDVTCPRSDRCVAVGYWTSSGVLQPLIEAWDGRRWEIDRIAMPASFSSSTLNSIDCAVPTSCRAVGTYQAGSPVLHSFSAALSDGGWVVQPIRGT